MSLNGYLLRGTITGIGIFFSILNPKSFMSYLRLRWYVRIFLLRFWERLVNIILQRLDNRFLAWIMATMTKSEMRRYAKRRAKIMALDAKGISHSQIAKLLGMKNRQRVWQIVNGK